MKKLLLAIGLLASLLASHPASSQSTTKICVPIPPAPGGGGVASCQDVTSAFPLPVGTTSGGGVTTPQIGCDSTTVYDSTINGSLQLVAGVAGKAIYVCGYTLFAAGTVNVELDAGTGTNCATSPIKIVPAYQFTPQTGVSDQANVFRGLKAPAGNALCIKTNAGVAVQAIIYYSQF